MISEELDGEVAFVGYPFLPQADFHLDLFLLPAPGGKIFIQDHEQSMKLFKRIYHTNELSPAEKKQLLVYLEFSIYQHKRFGSTLKRAARQLANAGFEVIPTPGIFYERKDKIRVNFLNGIIGMNGEEAYCISNGSLNSVDRYLRDWFVRIIKAHGIDHTYFVGRESEGTVSTRGKLEYKQSDMDLFYRGGIHCRTQVYPTNQVESLTPPSETDQIRITEPQQNQSLQEFYHEMLSLKG